ncbi:MAG: sulfatase-like hydrolase/transferase, partial [Bryobacterales bacterium]|nr:sulfatase-like hydrolase/transferase [Bryobacterales bacterium]
MLTRRAFALSLGAAGLNAQSRRPNVLFVSVDDMNDWVGCLGGYPGVQTPNIDRLARRGVLFRSAHCASPLCNPSRT